MAGRSERAASVETLSTRLDAHAQAFERKCQHDDQERAEMRRETRERHTEINGKIDKLAASVDEGFKTVNSEFSVVHSRITRQARAHWGFIITVSGTLIVILLGTLGWVLANGAPWAQH